MSENVKELSMHKDKHHPTVAIVMPVYNVAPYIERCVQSVMRQTFPATECIIVDDASTDDSISRCQRLIDDYTGPTRFVIVHHDHNRGLAAARNTGTDTATSDYIYYLDSDDEMTPDCLEKLSAPILQDDSIEMVMGIIKMDFSVMPGMLNRLKRWLKKQKASIESHNPPKNSIELRNNDEVYQWYYCGHGKRTISMANKLLKLSFVKEMNLYCKEGLLMEDRLWNFYLLRCLHHAVIVPDVTYIYHRRPGSITTGSGKKIEHHGRIYKEMADHVIIGERLEEIDNKIKGFFRNFIDAYDNPDYQYAYDVFLRQLSDGLHVKSVRQLKKVRRMSKCHLSRTLYKQEMMIKKRVKQIERFLEF